MTSRALLRTILFLIAMQANIYAECENISFDTNTPPAQHDSSSKESKILACINKYRIALAVCATAALSYGIMKLINKSFCWANTPAPKGRQTLGIGRLHPIATSVCLTPILTYGILKFFGSTFLCQAINAGSLSNVQLLLSLGVHPGGRASDNSVPLFQAIKTGNIAIIKTLLEAGADVNEDINSQTPLSYALMEKNITHSSAVVRLLLDYGANCSQKVWGKPLIMHAIEAGLIDASYALIEAGAHVNFATPDGTTPLHIAAKKDNPNFAGKLIKAGAHVNSLTRIKGTTPLMNAAELLNGATVAQLLKDGANPHIHETTEQKSTALMKACLSYLKLKKLKIAPHIIEDARRRLDLIMKALMSTSPVQATDRCPICLTEVKDITREQLRVTACCMKPICLDCSDAAARGSKICPLCRSKPIMRITPFLES